MRAETPVGEERQHDQRAGGEQQAVVQLPIREGLADDSVDLLPAGENDRGRNADSGCKSDIALCERAQQEIDDECDLGRQAGVRFAAADIPDDGCEGDEPQCDSDCRGSADSPADASGQSDQCECANACGAAVGSFTLAPLPLCAQQQSDAEGDREAQHGIGHLIFSRRS